MPEIAAATDYKFICKCECGGDVRGAEQFGRMFSYCDKCTPVMECKPPYKVKHA